MADADDPGEVSVLAQPGGGQVPGLCSQPGQVLERDVQGEDSPHRAEVAPEGDLPGLVETEPGAGGPHRREAVAMLAQVLSPQHFDEAFAEAAGVPGLGVDAVDPRLGLDREQRVVDREQPVDLAPAPVGKAEMDVELAPVGSQRRAQHGEGLALQPLGPRGREGDEGRFVAVPGVGDPRVEQSRQRASQRAAENGNRYRHQPLAVAEQRPVPSPRRQLTETENGAVEAEREALGVTTGLLDRDAGRRGQLGDGERQPLPVARPAPHRLAVADRVLEPGNGQLADRVRELEDRAGVHSQLAFEVPAHLGLPEEVGGALVCLRLGFAQRQEQAVGEHLVVDAVQRPLGAPVRRDRGGREHVGRDRQQRLRDETEVLERRDEFFV